MKFDLSALVASSCLHKAYMEDFLGLHVLKCPLISLEYICPNSFFPHLAILFWKERKKHIHL